MSDILSQKEIDQLLSAISMDEDEMRKDHDRVVFNGSDNNDEEDNSSSNKEDKIANYSSVRTINLTDINSPLLAVDRLKGKWLKAFEYITDVKDEYFDKIHGLTNKSLSFFTGYSTYDVESFNNWFKYVYNYEGYMKRYKLGDGQVLLLSDNELVEHILMGRNKNCKADNLSRNICDTYLFNPLVSLLSNKCNKSFIKQTDVINDVSLLDLPEDNFSLYVAEFYVKASEDKNGCICIILNEQAVREILNESLSCVNFSKDEEYYSDKTCYVTLGSTALSPYEVDNLNEGDFVDFFTYDNNALHLIYNGYNHLEGESVKLNNLNYGIRITKELIEGDKIEKDGSNAYFILGCSNISEEEIKQLKRGKILPLDSFLTDYFPLVYENNVVAVGKLVKRRCKISYRVVQKLDKPVPFIK